MLRRAKELLLTYSYNPLVFIICTGICIYITERDFNVSPDVYRLLLSLFLGAFIFIFISLSFTLFKNKLRTKYINQLLIEIILGCVLIAIYYNLYNHFFYIGYYIQYLHLLFIMVISITLVPFLLTKNKSLKYWRFINFLLSRLIIYSISIACLVFILFIALSIAKYLLELKITYKYYLDILYVGFLTVLPIRLLKDLYTALDENAVQQPNSILIKFGKFILIPCVVLYAIIIYSYFIKILISSFLPKNLIPYIIILYSVLGITSHILVYKECLIGQKKWFKYYLKTFYLSLIPLLVLYFYVVSIRIYYYGVTINRGLLIVLGAWFFLAGIYYITNKNGSIIILPYYLSFLLTISYIGPINIYSIAKLSQNSRLHHSITSSDKKNIVDYLSKYHSERTYKNNLLL